MGRQKGVYYDSDLSKRETNFLDIIERCKIKHDNRYGYSSVKYTNSRTPVEIICKTHGIFLQTLGAHVSGQGCPKCSYETPRNKLIGKDNFIHRSNIIHNNLYNYDEVVYVRCDIPVVIECPIHGMFSCTPIEHLRGVACSRCRMSHGEKFIVSILEKHAIKYEPQKKFKTCKRFRLLPFDFYLPEYNTLIEYQGRQHYMMVWRDKGDIIKLQERQQSDSIKKEWVKTNNISLIEIPYTEKDIEQYLGKKLSEVWDSGKNWMKVG